jgi:hypothetical protein
MKQHPPSNTSRIRFSDHIWAIALLVLILWVVRYWHSASFGLYEDDLFIVPQAVRMTPDELFRFVGDYLLQLKGHASPLSESFIFVFSFIGWKLNGLWGAYWLGYAIVALNVALFYLLLHRVTGSRTMAWLGGLSYSLFSADTTQAFLTHTLGLQPSLTLLLLALHSYAAQKRWLAYSILAIMLFGYETPFPVFLAAPLLVKTWDRRLRREIITHSLVLFAMLAAVFVLRRAIGEGRVAALGPVEMILTPLIHMLQGPFVSIGTFLYRPWQVIQSLDPEALIAAGLAFPALAWSLWRLKTNREFELLGQAGMEAALASNAFRTPARLALTGLIMLALAYPLTFTVRAYAISGRDTRVHLAGVVGAAILWACICFFVLSWMEARKRKLIGVGIIAIVFSLLVGYGFLIQKDYMLAWQSQKQLWSGLLPLIPDVNEGTVVLVDPQGLPEPQQISANTWVLPRLLRDICSFPSQWNHPPRV